MSMFVLILTLLILFTCGKLSFGRESLQRRLETQYLFESQNLTYITRGEIRIVVSLSTSPRRLPHIRGVIHSILKQSLQPDVIQLNLPRVFNRTGESYEENLRHVMDRFFHEFDQSRFRVVRCRDFGPLTKLLPTLDTERNESTMIVIIDDDTIYPKYMLETMLNVFKNNSNVILAGHCGNVLLYPPTEREQKLISSYPPTVANHPCCCRFFEGFGGIAFRRGMFNNRHLYLLGDNKPLDFWEYIDITMQNTSCLRADDIVISNYFSLVGTLGIDLKPHVKIWQLGHGFQDDALHRIDEKLGGKVKARNAYPDCAAHLQAKGLAAFPWK